ncbi:MAG TPA: SLBB domain-containing protein [Chitinophagales bacterium]|nr:SLBB domain-containing protein [Chitinophagales bacterium]
MKKLIASAILTFTLLITAHAQLSGVNLNQITSLISPSKIMNQMPTQSQSGMMGLDPNLMKMLLGSKENVESPDSKKPNTTNKPLSAIPVPAAGDAVPAANYDMSSPEGMFNMMYSQTSKVRELQDSIGLMQKKFDDTTLVKKNAQYVWGHQLFHNELLQTFVKSADAKAGDSYIVSIDDEITLAVWGYADYNGTFKVNQQGFIQIPEFGRVYVKGLTFGAVKQLIAKRLSSFINPSNTQYEITLNYSRNIVINILGEVNQPGTFQIPAINSVFNALNASDGPTPTGSLRNIEVRRDGRLIKTFDVYEFLLNGDARQNFFLQDNDVIYVPVIGKVVEISGAVRKSNKFEMKAGEGINKLIEFAGGLQASAYTDLIKVERFVNQKIEVINFNLTDAMNNKTDFEIKDGDKFFIPESVVKGEDAIEIAGTVLIPGTYQFKEGYRVSDLITIAGGMLPTTYMERAYLTRTLDDGSTVLQKLSLKDIFMDENAADNILLQKLDKLELFSKKTFIEKFSVSITGSVRKPVKIDYSPGLTLNDLIFYSGGLKKEAANNKIEVSRVTNVMDEQNESTLNTQRVIVQTIQVGPNLELDNISKNFQLAPMDQVFVRKNIDFNEQQNVSITGEILYPGTYSILSKDETIIQLIERSGGLTPYAHINSARLFRKDSVQAIEILDLKAAYSDSNSYANYALRDGDVIEIPLMNPMVSVKGSIKYPTDTNRFISAKYVPGKRAKYYINSHGGGYAPRSRKKATMVLHPNGDVSRTKSFLGIKRYGKVREGSEILTYAKPPKPEEVPTPKQPLNWNLILPSIIISLTSAASTIGIIFLLNK